MTNPYSRNTSKPMRNGVGSFDTTFTKILCLNSVCGIQILVLAASVSLPANVKPSSVVSIVVPRIDPQLVGHHESRILRQGLRTPPDSWLKTQQSFQCPSRLDLVRLLRLLHHDTENRTLHNPEHRYQTHVVQVKRQSRSLCWDTLKHDVPLVDTTCP